MTIYVGNLPQQATEEDVASVFDAFGKPISVKIITNPENGAPRGFAFVRLETPQEEQHAVENLQNAELEERPLIIHPARKGKERRDEKKGRGAGRGGRGRERRGKSRRAADRVQGRTREEDKRFYN